VPHPPWLQLSLAFHSCNDAISLFKPVTYNPQDLQQFRCLSALQTQQQDFSKQGGKGFAGPYQLAADHHKAGLVVQGVGVFAQTQCEQLCCQESSVYDFACC
jgi:hypothetical protein